MAEPRILIVEDEGVIAMDIQDALVALRYQVVGIAASAEQVLNLVEKERPDVVLMDIFLRGERDGIDAAAEIKRRYDIPTVFLTAFADQKTLDRAKVTEPYGYVMKPFRQAELHAAIELAIYKHKITKQRSLEPANAFRSATQGAVAVPNFQALLRPANLPSAAMQTTVRSFLEELPPFSGLERDMLDAVSSVCIIRPYKSHETLIQEGEARKEGFLVLSGHVAVFKSSSGGKELIVELLAPTDLFGVMAVLERAPFPFSARAQGPTRVLWIPKEVVSHVTQAYPDIGRELFERVLQRLRKAHDLSRALAHDKVEVRVASALLAMANGAAIDGGEPAQIECEMTRQELGNLVGTTPETVSRILNRLESDGLVDLSLPGKVRVTKPAGLSQVIA